MRAESNPQSERGVVNKRSGKSLRRKCTCGRIIVGNAAWHSHLTAADRRGEFTLHGFAGRV